MTVIQFPQSQADHPLAVGLPDAIRLELELRAEVGQPRRAVMLCPTLWDDTRRCIALVTDGPTRSTGLTATDARTLAGALLDMADALEAL